MWGARRIRQPTTPAVRIVPTHKVPRLGQMDSMKEECKCWVSVSDMSLPDLKGVFASGGLGVIPVTDGEPTS